MGEEIDEEDGGHTEEVGVKERRAEADVFSLGFQAEVAEAEEDSEGDDAGGGDGSEERGGVGDAGDESAVDGKDGGEEIEAANEVARDA